MCDSVLTPQQVQLVSKLNKYTKAKSGTDVGGVYIGQDPRLLWTTEGLLKFKHQVKHLRRVPKDGGLVDSEFLEKNTDVHQEGIEKGWFKQEEIIEEKKEFYFFGPDKWLEPKRHEPMSQPRKEGACAKRSRAIRLQPNICEKHDTTFVVDCCIIADFGSESEDDDWERKKSPFMMERNSTAIENSKQWLFT